MMDSNDNAPACVMHAARRVFVLQAVASVLAGAALAQPARPRVDEDDDHAKQLGYRHDTGQVDARRFPKHTKAQRCDNCSFYQGAVGEAWAGCAFFGRKQVAAPGWCLAWQPKPAG